VLVAVAVPVVLPVFVPLAVAFYWLRHRYVTTSREVKRFEAVTRSPVFAAFSESIKGMPTIRAFGAQARFQAAFLADLQRNGEWFHAFVATARWVGFRLDIISATTLVAAGLLAMAMHKWVVACMHECCCWKRLYRCMPGALWVARGWPGPARDGCTSCSLLCFVIFVLWLAAATSPPPPYPTKRRSVETYILALALTYTLQLTGLMQWFVRQTAEVENNMTALERLLE
jgi:ABC-type multidrug transport system fused ATPase/permease subunit